MTKAELIAALQSATGIPDDAPVFVEPWPEGQPAPQPGDLQSISTARAFLRDGPDGDPFIVLDAEIKYV